MRKKRYNPSARAIVGSVIVVVILLMSLVIALGIAARPPAGTPFYGDDNWNGCTLIGYSGRTPQYACPTSTPGESRDN